MTGPKPHPHIAARLEHGAPTAAHAISRLMPARVNQWLAVNITNGVSTMWCAYAFAVLSMVAAPQAFASHNAVVIVGWVSQTFLQLVFLPILSVGQAVQARAGDLRAKATFDDATAILSDTHGIREQLGEIRALLDSGK